MKKILSGNASRRFMLGAIASAIVLSEVCCGGSAFSATTPFVLAYTDGQDPQAFTNFKSFHSNLSAVALGSAYGILATGALDLTGITATNNSIISSAKSYSLPIYPTVSDYSNAIQAFDPNISQTISKTAASRATAVTNLVNLAVSNGFAGINLDMEAVGQETNGPTAADTSNFTAFVTALAAGLHAKGLKLIESIPASDGTSAYAWLGGYNYAALGAQVDYLQVMTYDEVGPGWYGSPATSWPGPCSGLNWMNNVMTYVVSQVPSTKILLGLPTYGYDFSTGAQQTWAADSNYATLGFTAYIKKQNATTYLDSASDTPYANWGAVTQQTAGWATTNAQPSMWYDTPATITAKAGLVSKYKLAGTGVWAMGYEDVNFWNAHNAGLGSGGGGGGTNSNIAPSGKGEIWSGMSSATANTGEVANILVNNGSNTTSITLSPNGENGAVKYEAAGVIWSSTHSVSSVIYENGPIDSNGNGYFQSGFSMEYTTNGTTWVQSGWTTAPVYPYSTAAGSQSYTFTGTALTGVLGVRVVGAAGASSWSGSVTQVEAIGQ